MNHPSARLSLYCSLLAIFTLPAAAQRPEGGPPGGSGRGFMRGSPLMAALDTDKDGSLSADEMKNAETALKTLDKDGDGKLSPEELRPPGREGEGGRGGNPVA